MPSLKEYCDIVMEYPDIRRMIVEYGRVPRDLDEWLIVINPAVRVQLPSVEPSPILVYQSPKRNLDNNEKSLLPYL